MSKKSHFISISSLCSMAKTTGFRLFPFVLDMHDLTRRTLKVSFFMIKNLSNELRMRIDNFLNVRISGIRISGIWIGGRVLYYSMLYMILYYFILSYNILFYRISGSLMISTIQIFVGKPFPAPVQKIP